jgi:hypothetical protein
MMRATHLAVSLLMPPLLGAGCAGTESVVPLAHDSAQSIVARAPALGQQLRAAMLCGVPVSPAAQDRAATIEAVAIAQHHQQGGTALRDAFLASLAPPTFAGRKSDRFAWCASQRPEIERSARWLESDEGATWERRAAQALGQ